ncbi:MAG: hypothetical protein WC707_05655 [Candidatus Babeliaceae bacterium]|jgi:hypothetical protein
MLINEINILQPFAEIIESSLHTWKAHSWKWSHFPSYGSLVTLKQGSKTIFGIVYGINTGSSDPARTPFPYQKTEQELLKDQPQIFEFLKTTFDCLTVGFIENGTLSYQCALQPPKIHAFVQYASPEETAQFFAKEHYMPIIFNFGHLVINIDELLLAVLKNRSLQGQLSENKVKSFVGTYSLLTNNDYRRLKIFLQRLSC